MIRRVCSVCVVALLVLSTSLSAQAGKIKADSAAAAARVRLRILATRFLDSATFGAKKSDVDALVLRMEQIDVKPACEEWIDQQLALPPTLLQPLALQMMADDGIDPLQTNAWVQRYRHHAFWHAAVAAPDQLRQRVGWALSQIPVINTNSFNFVGNDAVGTPQYLGPLNYYDMLLNNSFGNYRGVLTDVSLHPCMGVFLSHLRNRKGNPAINRFPDENYAREIMQLFSIGLYELDSQGNLLKDPSGNFIPTYNNEDIKAAARVFTGLRYAPAPGNNQNNIWTPANFSEPMGSFEPEHDTAEKLVLGATLPAGQTVRQDIDDFVDVLMNHPSIGPFIGRRLIQRLVKSNPSQGYLMRVSQVFQSTNGDMSSLIKAVLLDSSNDLSFRTIQEGPNEWSVEVLHSGTEDSRLKEPMLQCTEFLRKFDAQSDYPTGRVMMADLKYHWTQGFLASPSVFNFYLPDFQPPGDIVGYQGSANLPNDGSLFAPEFELLTAVTSNRIINWFRSVVYNERSAHTLLNNSSYTFRCNLDLDFSQEKALAADPAALVDHLDVLLTYGSLDEEVRQMLIDALTEETTSTTARARAAILLAIVSPRGAVASY